VTVDKSITLQGLAGAVIDAGGCPIGVRMMADGATVEDLTVTVNGSAKASGSCRLPYRPPPTAPPGTSPPPCDHPV
jgi:nitrous oxidase accessory protein NosD